MGDAFQPLEMLGPEGVQTEKKPLEFEYTLKGETLSNVSSTPYLGICFSETLEWEAHINKITSKADPTQGFLQRNLKACPPKLRETAYFSLVRSYLEYSSEVWDLFRQKDIDKLKKKFQDQQQYLSPKIIDKQPVWHLSFRTWAGPTWKQDVKILDYQNSS